MKRRTREKLKNEKGITLVALVVTIVVLLILAGISLNLVLGRNGIVSKSKEAREKGTQDQENTETALNTLYNEMIEAINDDENPSGENRPKLTGENWDEILEYANANPEEYKYPGQQKSDIGIGTDGQPVNLDLWNYAVSGNTIELCTTRNGSFGSPGYENANIVQGKIQGKVPQYINPDGQNEFYPVTSMAYAFYNCENLEVAPEIPSSVTYMDHTFSGCANLTTAPTIPNSVTNMQFAFLSCDSLTIAPEIPSNVTNMKSIFSGCSSLTTAQPIPSSVTEISYAFYGCSSLTGNIVINGGSSYIYCFTDAATNAGTNLIVSGTSTKLDAIIATKSENSNITKAEGL